MGLFTYYLNGIIMNARKYAMACATLIISGFIQKAIAQTPSDGFSMGKGEICVVASYGQSKWKEYWEGKRLRENLNLGQFTSKKTMPMAGYGITDKWNVFVGLPYINNSSDAGTMTGKKGWQDLAIDVKYQALEIKKGAVNAQTFLTAGFSTPLTDYPPDFLPYSIGIGSTTGKFGLVEHIEHSSGLFLTLYSAYMLRSNIEVDRSTYYTDQQYYSKEMAVPDVWEGSVRLGFNKTWGRANGMFNWNTSTSGSDIRRNDMPYPGNRMNVKSLAFQTLIWIPGVNGLAFNGMVDQVIGGRNVGKAFSWMTGLQYVFNPFQKTTHEKK
jgi:hypothetical protein